MRYLFALVLSILLFPSGAISQPPKIVYPLAQKQSITDDYFGTLVTDPYRWMENDTSAQTKEWVKQENDLSKKYLSKLLNKYPFESQLNFNSVIDFGSTLIPGLPRRAGSIGNVHTGT